MSYLTMGTYLAGASMLFLRRDLAFGKPYLKSERPNRLLESLCVYICLKSSDCPVDLKLLLKSTSRMKALASQVSIMLRIVACSTMLG